MYNKNDFFDELEKNGIHVTDEQKIQINKRINSILTYEPKIGIFGKTGVGKSSLCNALFGKDVCQISDVEACTRDLQEVILGMGQKGMKLLDVPGVGESSDRDKEYSELYAKLLPDLDLVLWLIKSDDRALASDENFYKNIVKPHIDEGKAFFFVLNQVDKIEPFREWNEEKHEPGSKQFQNIHRKVDDVARFFGVAASKVIPVSANERFNLTKLVDEIVFALPKDKKVTFFKEVNEDFKSESSGEHVKKSFMEVVGDVVGTAIEKAGDVIVTTVETVGRVVEKALDKVADKIDDWFSRGPFGGGRSSGGGCYITTATCEYLNKPDDCYELNQLREFRDNWLANQEDGKALIEQYYNTAPQIVSTINQSKNKDKIYTTIWNEYLSKCLTLIEDKRYEECKSLYIKMVEHLKDVEINGVICTD